MPAAGRPSLYLLVRHLRVVQVSAGFACHPQVVPSLGVVRVARRRLLEVLGSLGVQTRWIDGGSEFYDITSVFGPEWNT